MWDSLDELIACLHCEYYEEIFNYLWIIIIIIIIVIIIIIIIVIVIIIIIIIANSGGFSCV